jgi:ATP-dependent DNA ligase
MKIGQEALHEFLARPPSGKLWVHEIKHDGYRLMVRRDGAGLGMETLDLHQTVQQHLLIF